MRKFIFIYILLTTLFGQFTLTEEQVNNLFDQMRTLEIKDSLNTVHIQELKNSIDLYKKLESENELIIQDKDSLIVLLNEEITLQNDRIKEISPAWYDNKWIWFTLGVLSTGGSVHLAGQISNYENLCQINPI